MSDFTLYFYFGNKLAAFHSLQPSLSAYSIGYNLFTGTIPGSLSRFSNMRFDAVNNQITKVNGDLCSMRGWWNGEVGKVIDNDGNGCDAILCPKGTYNAYGRAKSSTNGGCLSCPNGKFAGAIGCAGVTDDDDTVEKKILDRLFIETGGSNWVRKNNWENGTVCEYEGIKCSSSEDIGDESVVEINLAGFGLTARIPTHIYKLPSLRKIDFSNNIVDLSFDGIEQAQNLEELLMEDADLSSVDGISDAPSLKKVIANLISVNTAEINHLHHHSLHSTRAASHLTQQFPGWQHS